MDGRNKRRHDVQVLPGTRLAPVKRTDRVIGDCYTTNRGLKVTCKSAGFTLLRSREPPIDSCVPPNPLIIFLNQETGTPNIYLVFIPTASAPRPLCRVYL